MENKVKVWLARDEDGKLYAHLKRPNKMRILWESEVYTEIFRYDNSFFPSVKWEDDEPTEAYITLAEPQPTPNQEIDWEELRYEIVKDISAAIHSRPTVKTALLNVIISAADNIIKELKKQSDND